ETFTVAAVGDYNNDLEMLEFADIAIAPQNAQDIVKKSADYVTNSTCEEGAIAEAIDYLDKLK
ncbi:MAG: HAD hydrolase family protein, partial [Oscillospiraceae bacterium]|nr:HAD hydrolase family protein [Oscillospiraceae bacterium]